MVSHSNEVINSHPETEYKPYESKLAILGFNILMMKKNPVWLYCVLWVYLTKNNTILCPYEADGLMHKRNGALGGNNAINRTNKELKKIYQIILHNMSFKELVRKDVSSCCKECLVNDKYSGINFGYYD